MGSLPALPRLTPEEYLELERTSFERNEYVDGAIYAMPGGTPRHAEITANTIAYFVARFRGTTFRAYSNDLKVWIPSAKAFLYPDVSIVCGELRMKSGSKEAVENPKVVIEVLSQSTELYDRTKKFRLYKSIPELRHYVLVQQSEPLIEVFTADERGFWIQGEYPGIDASFELDAIGVSVPLAEIHQEIDFAESEN